MWYVGTHTYWTVWVLRKVADLVVHAFGHLAQTLFASNALFDDVGNWRYDFRRGTCGIACKRQTPLGFGTRR